MNYILAFIVGGLICVAVQILMDNTKLLPGRIMVILVCTGVILGALGWYEPFEKWAGAGATVPLLGFGNVLFRACNNFFTFARKSSQRSISLGKPKAAAILS